MDQYLGQHESSKGKANEAPMRGKNNGEKSNKCKQCDFVSSWSSNLRTHMKIHSGKKLNKCNQCEYASSQAGDLRTHLKTHRGEKSNKS